MKNIIGFFEALLTISSCGKGKPLAIISFDLESPIDSPLDDFEVAKRLGKLERNATEKVVGFLDEFEIPATFFATGHALMKECKGHKREIDILGNSRYCSKGTYIWSRIDPSSNCVEYPEFYYGDLAEKIAEVGMHELASHSFSHIPYPLVDDKTLLEDLDLSRAAINSYGLKLYSFAFPFNLVGKCLLLRRFGIKIARGGHFKNLKLCINKDGLLIMRSHITDIAFSERYFSIIVECARRSKGIVSWYLHPKTLADEGKFKIFKKTLLVMKDSFEFKTFGELHKEIVTAHLC